MDVRMFGHKKVAEPQCHPYSAIGCISCSAASSAGQISVSSSKAPDPGPECVSEYMREECERVSERARRPRIPALNPHWAYHRIASSNVAVRNAREMREKCRKKSCCRTADCQTLRQKHRGGEGVWVLRTERLLAPGQGLMEQR